MKELTFDIDLDQEVRALAAFVAKKWTPIAGLEEMFREIRDVALHAGRAWHDRYELGHFAHELRDQREKLLATTLQSPAEKDRAVDYDAIGHYLFEAFMLSMDLHDNGLNLDGKWDYSRKVSALVARMAQKYPDLLGARPLGWDALAANYTDFDGQEDYDPRPDMDLFEGCRVEGATSSHFPYRVALPYVMYDEKCQGYKAHHVLVGSVFAQFLGIREYLNTEGAKRALQAWFDKQAPQLTFQAPQGLDHPLLRVIAKLAKPAYGEQEYREACRKQAEWLALSEAEKEARRNANKDSVSALIKALCSDEDDGSAARKREERNAHVRAALLEEFGA